MKKAVIPGIIFLLIISFYQSFSQSAERNWEEGELTWEDFKGEAFSSSPHVSELFTQLGYSATKKKFKDTSIYLFETRNYINPQISWVKEQYKTDKLLQYNQVIFNIMEVHRRRLQHELHRIYSIYMAEEKYRTHFAASTYEVKRLQEETNYGTDFLALESWDRRVKKELEALPYNIVPEIKNGNFGYGFQAGFGSGVFTNNLKDHFKPTFNFIFGFDFAFKNTILFLNGTLAGNRVKKEFIENDLTWAKDMKTNVAIMELSIGQSIIDNAKHKVTPFVGLGVLEFTAKDEELVDHKLVDSRLIYGINYDFKLRKFIRLTPPPFGTFREKSESSIRTKLYITSGKYDNLKGTSINLSVSYAIFGRIIKVQ